jgi:peptide/nickel transport system substrate-binding protein
MAVAQSSGTFRQAHAVGSGSASDLDPISKGRVFEITDKIMSRLVRADMAGKPAADLALSWSANATATEWTFRLRPGVTFHNGKRFGAEDVVYSFDRVRDPKNDSPARATVQMVSRVEAVDPLTVRMTLSEPFADLPLILTDYRLRIVPKDSGDTIARSGIGTGPFRVERFDPQGVTVLVANPNYFGGAPSVARMEIVGIPDGQARLQALLGGQIDMEPGITRQQRVLLDRSGRHTVQEVPTGNWRGIVFRTDVRPFDDVRVRRAIRMAVDRKALLDLVAGGAGAIGCDTPVGPTDQYRAPHDAARECPQNIEGARRLLAEAGFPNGIDFDLQVATLEPVWPTLAEAFQQQVAGAGIRVRINQVPSDGYWSQVWMRRDAVMTRWNQRPADATLNEIFRTGSAWNESHFKDPRFDAILDAARRELDFDKRKALYIDAQNHLRDNSGTLVAFHATVFVGTTNRVRDLDPVEYFSIRWNRVKVN